MEFWYTQRSVTFGVPGNYRTVGVAAPYSGWTVHSGGVCRLGRTFGEAVDALAKPNDGGEGDEGDAGDPEGAEWMRANREDIMRRLGLTPEGEVPGE